MKKINNLVFIICFLLIIVSCKSDKKYNSPEGNFSIYEGNWNWENNDQTKDFSLDLKVERDSIFGSYCLVFSNGSKIDCRENGFSFKTKLTSEEILTNFESSFTNSTGKVKLSISKNNKLTWELVVSPEGHTFLPKKAVLIK